MSKEIALCAEAPLIFKLDIAIQVLTIDTNGQLELKLCLTEKVKKGRTSLT